MLKDRLSTSAVLILIVSVLLVLDARSSSSGLAGLWLLPLLFFFGLGTAWDAATMMLNSGRAIGRLESLLTTFLVMASSCVPMLWPLFGSPYPDDCPLGKLGWIVIGAVASVFCVLMVEMIRYGKGPQGVIERIGGTVFVSLYVGLPFSLMVATRWLGIGNWGLAALLTIIIVTKSCDAGAYFTGRALGRHKLIPRLSPGKTVEGAIGGILTSTIVAFVCLKWLFPNLTVGLPHPSLYAALILGPVLAIAGMAGDLAESLVKRDCGAKDSGNWLPGLGGVWDVTDSLLAAAMPGFLCFVALV
jgi:phosphatidate cytidylyltransferase